MTRQLIIQICALLALVGAAFFAGRSGETPAGKGVVTAMIIVVLMLVILGATMVPA